MSELRFTRWGCDQTHMLNEGGITIKTLFLLGGRRISLQYHRRRREFWHFVTSARIFDENGSIHLVGPDSVIVHGVMVRHRVGGSTELSIVTEVSAGEFEEEDVVRLQDDFGRVAQLKGSTLRGTLV